MSFLMFGILAGSIVLGSIVVAFFVGHELGYERHARLSAECDEIIEGDEEDEFVDEENEEVIQ